jgi:hypothetical protein
LNRAVNQRRGQERHLFPSLMHAEKNLCYNRFQERLLSINY